MNKEDNKIEIDLNHIAYEVLEKLPLKNITKDLNDKIKLLAETVMEDTASKIIGEEKIDCIK